MSLIDALLALLALCVGGVSPAAQRPLVITTTPSSSSSSADNNTNSTDYDYDPDVSHNTFYWEELIPPLVVYGVTLVLGIAGNVLIIFTISRYRRLKSTTNVFLASLASADLLLIIFCIPVKVAKLFSYTWGLGFFLCKLVHYMQNVSAICSVLTLTAMSIERYYAIVHPMRAKYVCTISQARRIIICIWFASFILAVPILIVQVMMPVGMKIPAFWCVRDWENAALWRYHELYMLLLILVVPTIVMAGTYSAICWEVWHVMKRRYDMTGGHARASGTCRRIESMPLRYKRNSSGTMRESVKKANAIKAEEDSRTVKQVIKMLVAVVVLFVICWAPMLIDNVLTAFEILPHLRLNGLKHMATAFHLMAYFNSCINPIVYGFMSRNFRDSFYKALCRCCYRTSIMKRQPSVSHTRTTSVRYTIDTSFGRRVSISTSAY